jgi:hypothetical protein
VAGTVTREPGLPSEQIAALQALAEGETFVLVGPYRDAPAPVVASAWGLQLQLDQADDDRLQRFVRAYQVGPQTSEPDAPCTGGIGQPTA